MAYDVAGSGEEDRADQEAGSSGRDEPKITKRVGKKGKPAGNPALKFVDEGSRGPRMRLPDGSRFRARARRWRNPAGR